MGLVDVVKGIVAPRTPRIEIERLRKAKPMRNPFVEWEMDAEGNALLQAPLALQNPGLWGALARKMKAPNMKRFELEPVGALVWEHCDGKHTVETISRKLRERYKMNRLEADASLAAFLQMLSQRRLITLMVGQEK